MGAYVRVARRVAARLAGAAPPLVCRGRMPTKSRKSKGDLQAFRKSLSRLKRAGLSNVKSPEKATRTKANVALLRKFGAVATGNSSTVKLSPKMAALYREAKTPGITIVQPVKGSKQKPTAIVSNRVGYTKTQISKGEPLFEGMIARIKPLKNGEIETIVLPISTSSIPRFIEALRTHPQWNNLKMNADRFTLRFNVEGTVYGLNDPRQFGTMDQLATFLQGYQSAVTASNSSRRSQGQYLEMLEVVRIKKNRQDLRTTDQKEAGKLRKKLGRYIRLKKRGKK